GPANRVHWQHTAPEWIACTRYSRPSQSRSSADFQSCAFPGSPVYSKLLAARSTRLELIWLPSPPPCEQSRRDVRPLGVGKTKATVYGLLDVYERDLKSELPTSALVFRIEASSLLCNNRNISHLFSCWSPGFPCSH